MRWKMQWLGGAALAAACAAAPVASAQVGFPAASPGEVTLAMESAVDDMWDGLLATTTPGQSGYDTNFAESVTAALFVDWQDAVINYDYQVELVQYHMLLPLATSAQELEGVKGALRDGLVAYYLGNQVSAANSNDEPAVAILMVDLAAALVANASSSDEEVELIVEEIVLGYRDAHPLGETTIFDDFLATPLDTTVFADFQNALAEELGGAASCCQGTSAQPFPDCVKFCKWATCRNKQSWAERRICGISCAIWCILFLQPPY